MTDNKENSVNPQSEKDTSKKVDSVEKKDAKKNKAPLWIRVGAFAFSLLTAGVLLYSISLDNDAQGKACAEKEKQRQELLILQDRVAQLEQNLKISEYIQGGGNSQLKTDIETIFAKIGFLEENLHSSASNTLDEIKDTMLSDETMGKVDKLAQEFLSLKGSVENLFTEKEILKEQANQINKNIKSITEKQSKRLQTFFAFEKLKSTVNSQSPYYNELDTLKKLLNNTDENKLKFLERNKDTGIPSIESLTQQLRKYIKIAITTSDENSDWWDKTKTNMSKVVTVRKQGYVEGNDVDAILARAEYNLDTNQTIAGLASAMDEVKKLPPEKLVIFSEWMNDANTIINTQKVLNEIRQSLLLEDVK